MTFPIIHQIYLKGISPGQRHIWQVHVLIIIIHSPELDKPNSNLYSLVCHLATGFLSYLK